ncbi:MAG TPA: dihydrolipoamide acetyltransferase family protein [Acidimicrobiales bacterium]|nr:dihydrolipoamide acetyltransferase family protein [Acidimicrobiales bacterium]
MIDITMPRLSDTMEEGTIARWHKQPGDAVNVGDVLVEIETDKATMDYEAYEAGILAEILVPEGEVATIGTPIARLDNGKASVSSTPAASSVEPVAPSQTTPSSESAIDDETRDESSWTVAASTSDDSAQDAERRIASPLVRKLAREHDLDLRQVRGSGPGGRIIRADLDGLLAVAQAEAEAHKGPAMPLASGPLLDAKRGSEQIPFTNVRRVIARRLGESARTVPHFYATAVADAEALVQLRSDLNDQLLATGRSKVSVNDLLIRACALALREHPLVNASYVSDASTTMLVHHRINIGVAVASINGLVVPVITDADQKSVSQLGAETKQLATQAGTKGLSLDQMSGGTFTISNLGMYGIEEFTAIINPPESAILAVGATKREPVGVGDEIVLRHRLRYTLSADHRIIDGALAAEFLQTLTRLIESPLSLIV